MTPEHYELLENVLYMLAGGCLGVIPGFILSAILGSGATSDREKAAFASGVEYEKNRAARERGAAPRVRPAAPIPSLDYLSLP